METLAPPAIAGKLLCLACGEATDCLSADLAQYTRTIDWPRCCGRVMAFTPRKDKPGEAPSD